MGDDYTERLREAMRKDVDEFESIVRGPAAPETGATDDLKFVRLFGTVFLLAAAVRVGLLYFGY